MRKNRLLLALGIMTFASAIALSGCAKKAALEPATTAAEAAPETKVEEKKETEAATEAPEEELVALDFSGKYSTPDKDATIELKQTSQNQYDVNLGIFRLCDMDGKGNWVDGAIEIEFTDPSGKPMYGVFFYNEDDFTYTLRITQSDWTYIDSQTDFTGFTIDVDPQEALINLKDGVLKPMNNWLDIDNVSDATIPAGFWGKSLKEKDGKLTLDVEIYSEDIFDAVDVSMLEEGSTIVLGGEPQLVMTKEEGKDGYDINGGLEKGGFELVSNGGGTYRYRGFDDISSFTYDGSRTFPVSEKCVFTDSFDLERGEQKVEYKDLLYYMEDVSETSRDFFNPYNTKIVVEDGKITEIVRWYRP